MSKGDDPLLLLRGPDVVGFLQHLLRQVPGQLLVVWDGSPIHRAQVVKDFLAQGAAKRLRLEPLPAYAPELNPAEGLWHTLERVELRNVLTHSCPSSASRSGGPAAARLRHKPERLRGYVRYCTRAL